MSATTQEIELDRMPDKTPVTTSEGKGENRPASMTSGGAPERAPDLLNDAMVSGDSGKDKTKPASETSAGASGPTPDVLNHATVPGDAAAGSGIAVGNEGTEVDTGISASGRHQKAFEHACGVLEIDLPDTPQAAKDALMLIFKETLKTPEKKKDAVEAVIALCRCLGVVPDTLPHLRTVLYLCFPDTARTVKADPTSEKVTAKTEDHVPSGLGQAVLVNAMVASLVVVDAVKEPLKHFKSAFHMAVHRRGRN